MVKRRWTDWESPPTNNDHYSQKKTHIFYQLNSLIIQNYFFLHITDNKSTRTNQKKTNSKQKPVAKKMMESTVPLTFLRSQRGKPILLYNNYRHRKERELSGNKEYWRCMLEKCKGRLVICNGFIVKSKDHTHSPPLYSWTHRSASTAANPSPCGWGCCFSSHLNPTYS